MKLTHKKKATVTTGALAIALLLSGSLAWHDYTQHKTNNFTTKTVDFNVTLIEDFEEVSEWEKGQAIVKAVSVRNGEDADTAKSIYKDAYIRLQFKEYMEIGERTYVYSENRYMIDTDGNFYRFSTQAEAEAFLATLNQKDYDSDLDPQDRIVSQKGYFDDQAYFYIRTQAHDPNGQYGKFVILDVEEEMKSIIDGQTNQSESARNDKQHDENPADNNESQYTVKTWDDSTSAFEKYVEWQLGEDVITLEQWIEGGKQPVAKWIIDTTSDEGWVYWGQALAHSKTASVPETLTPNFLETVTLIEQPNGTAFYQINVVMDAVSIEDLDLWVNGNKDIVNMLKGSEGSAPVEDTQLKELLQELQDLIDEAKLIDSTTLEDASAQDLLDAINNGETVHDKSGVTAEEVQNAIDNLQDVMDNLVVKATGFDITGKKVGDKIQFANRTFTIAYIDEATNTALILSDVLSYSDLNTADINHGILSNRVRYQNNGTSRTAYSGSYLKTADTAFYNTFINGKQDSEFVLAVNLPAESASTNWNSSSATPTTADENGTKTAFSLSVSDVNRYGISNTILDANTEVWLRTPANGNVNVAIVNSQGRLTTANGTTGTNALRPALWISITK